MPNMIDVLRF